jgi:hypothetical protein
MKRLAWLVLAFALLVAGIESLKVLAAWWQAGRPTPELPELLALLAFAVAGFAWWRHSVFTCRDQNCRLAEKDRTKAPPTR